MSTNTIKSATNEVYDRVVATMSPEQVTKFNEAIDATRPVVEAIEDSREWALAPTKDHYGSYLPLAKDRIAVLVLLLAGANRAGVLAAARINGVL